MYRTLISVLLGLTCACANAHLTDLGQNNLQPVQGLFIKPSTDGVTGDLYVAASEDSGTNAQWVAEHPINFLSSYSKTQPSTLPGPSANEDITIQKQAVIPSSPVQYNFGVAKSGAEASKPMSCPYAAMAANLASSQSLSSSYPEGYPYPEGYQNPYSLYQYFYPYLMQAAAASAATALKDLGLCEELANAVTSQGSSAWSHSASYAYPWQYMMVDPKTLAERMPAAVQTTTSQALTPTALPTNKENTTTQSD